MLEPRIYRMALVPVVLAAIVLAFSLEDQQGGLGTNLAPDAYVAQNAYAKLGQLTGRSGFPHRRPGSSGDSGVANYVASELGHFGFAVSRESFTAGTVGGTRALENVLGTRAGLVPGTIAVVAHRDALGSPARAELSGTAVLLELARLLSGETQHHTIALASTSGSVGAEGASQLAGELPQPVDAVIVLGDLAGTRVHAPAVVPWSDGQLVAPPMLRNTLAGALGSQAGLSAAGNSLGGQIAHLAFPMTSSEQAAFGAAGEPAALVSVSGDRVPAADEPTSLTRITGTGRAVLQALTALDNSGSVPAPSSYLLWSGKVVPAWAIRLLVLALIVPVAAVTIDGVARARRRRLPILRSVVWVLSAALPFAAACVLVALAHVTGLIAFAPSIPAPAGAVRLGAGGICLLALMACAILGGLLWIRPTRIAPGGPRAERSSAEDPGAGASVALPAVLCMLTLLMWLANPFQALLIVPGLHLWLWLAAARRRLPRPVTAGLVICGLVLPGLVAAYYGLSLGVGPLQLAWSWVLLLAGGALGWATALEWSVFAGCAVGAAVLALRVARVPAPDGAPITIRGPVTYAGPGSLGGTRSALRR